MAREFVLVGLLVALLAAAWLWLADSGELAHVDWFAPSRDARDDSASRQDLADSTGASRHANVGEGEGAATTDAEPKASFTRLTVPDPPIFVPHEFVVLGPYRVPIRGAVAAFTIDPEWGEPPGMFATAVSDADGRIGAELVAGALYSVHVEASGYANHESELTANLGRRTWIDRIDLDPLESVTIEGDVVAPGSKSLPANVLDLLRYAGESGGAPLDPRDSPKAARAWVVFVPSAIGVPTRLESSYDVRPHVDIDERGGFRFGPQPLGVVGELQLHWCDRVLARAAWSGRGDRARLVLDPEPFLASLCTLEIAVTGFAGAADEDWLALLVHPEDECFHFDRRIARGDDRSLVFARLPAGVFWISLTTTRTLARRRVELAPGATARVELDADVAATLVAIVHGTKAEGDESLGAPPSIADENGFECGDFAPARGVAIGEYRAVLPQGRYVVTYGSEARPIELRAGGTATLEFARRELMLVRMEVRVPDPANYALRDKIAFSVTLESSDGTLLCRTGMRTTVGADGNAVGNMYVATGEYRVVVGLDGKEASAPLRVRADEPEVALTLAFDA